MIGMAALSLIVTAAPQRERGGDEHRGGAAFADPEELARLRAGWRLALRRTLLD